MRPNLHVHSVPFVLLAVLLCSILARGLVHAQVLSAPDVVTAAADGSFSYTLTFTYPSEGAYFGSTHYEGLINCELDLWVDGFCMSFVGGGTVQETLVEGMLTDPGLDGRVRASLDTCDVSFSGSTETVITHTVPAKQTSWSTMKANYQR